MRIGLNFVPHHESPEEWAEILTGLGYRASCFPVDYKAPASLIDEYVKAAKEHDIRIAEVGIWNSPHHPDQKIASRAKEACLEQFRLAEYIKAACCVNVSGAAGDIWHGCYKENFTEDLYWKNVAFIQELCDQVKPQNTYYTLEPMQWMVPCDPIQYRQLMKDVDRDCFAVHMDAVNFVKDPYTYTHMPELIEETFDLLSPYIKSCHLKDCVLEPGLTVRIREVVPGQGEFPILQYLKRIETLDAEMPVMLEHLKDMTLYEQAYQHIKSLGY